MFDTKQDWARRRRVNLIVTAGLALLGVVLLVWGPEGARGVQLSSAVLGGIAVGLSLHLVLFRRPAPLDPEALQRIEAGAPADARRVMLWTWAIAILWGASWLTAGIELDRVLGIDPAAGLSLGVVIFLFSLVLMPFAARILWRDLRRDGLGVWHASLNDELTRQFRAQADAAAMQAGLTVALILSALSFLEIWPLAGHELGYLTAGAMALTVVTRRWQLERDAAAGGDD